MGVCGAFRFHSVGQGLFYSGILNQRNKNSRKTFSFVYDCGSESARKFLNEEISDYKLLIPNVSGKKKLNLLVVSHLHDDHINGLERLLQDMDVDNVVMPYVNDGLKLLAQLESDRSDEFLMTFYADPIAWFISKGVRRIILLGSEESDHPTDAPESRFHRNPETDDLYVDGDILRLEHYEETTVVYLGNKSKLYLRDFDWRFVVENLSVESNKTEQYIKIVEDFKKKKLLSLNQIFKSKLLTTELKHALKGVFSGGDGINRTSVVLLHGPEGMAKTGYIASPQIDIYCENAVEHGYCETILTGDIRLAEGEHLDMFSQKDDKHYFVIQYPHHGADNNIEYFCSLSAERYLISYGLTNRYGHPDSSIFKKTLSPIIEVNERLAFDYQIHIE
ncbi:hypothetical protein H7U40_07425 [Flavonifractor plautii]|uniref:hypothetical protein n=1 Tax=Flavonifractor plautii TaxID=292800 RepID=UPI00195922B5|nr:hypothetical protein [Flavonifractor plautii]MBM6790098.1 hypothetical protein [Flavonifractor plautii]